jgi:hypothetical protein
LFSVPVVSVLFCGCSKSYPVSVARPCVWLWWVGVALYLFEGGSAGWCFADV